MKFEDSHIFTILVITFAVLGIASLPTPLIMWLCNCLFVLWAIELIWFLYMFVKEYRRGGVAE